MKAHIMIPQFFVNQTGYDVLAAVLLHQIEPPLPVDFPYDPGPNFQRTVTQVENPLPCFPHIQHVDAAQGAQITGLSAPFGKKSRGVQFNYPSTVMGLTAHHPGSKILHHAVRIIKLVHKMRPSIAKIRPVFSGRWYGLQSAANRAA